MYDEPPYEEPPEPPLKVNLEFTVGDLDSVVRSIVYNVSKTLTDQMTSEMKAEVTKIVRDDLKHEADNLVERIASGLIQPTNKYGDPTGPALPLKAMFEKNVEDYLNEKVGKDGNAPRYGEKGRPRLEWYIESIIQAQLNEYLALLKTELSESVKTQYDAALKKEIAKLLGNMMTVPLK